MATEQVGAGENCGTPASETVALFVLVLLTMTVNTLPLPPPPVPLVAQAALVGSPTHRFVPLRVTVAVGEPVAVVNVQLPVLMVAL